MTKITTPDYLKHLVVAEQPSPLIHDETYLRKVRRTVAWNLWKAALKVSGNPFSAFRLMRAALNKYQTIKGNEWLQKVAFVDGRYFFGFTFPGYPSLAANERMEFEIQRLFPNQSNEGLAVLFLGLTNKCALQCEHCYEWQNLNQPDQLTVGELLVVIKAYQNYGAAQIMFSGGEPMLRYKDLLWILERTSRESDFWVVTSGLGLTRKRAEALKAAGLTGVMVGLDHYLPNAHDKFRGFEGAFQQATQAVNNANAVGLVTTLSFCPVKRFLRRETLERYMELAKYLGVSFVQLLEPRAVGRYQDKEVEFGPAEIAVVEAFYLRYNAEPDYLEYPIINYTGYHQRRFGCLGSGNRFMYIDANGLAHNCPFCHHASIDVRHSNPEEVIKALQQSTCAAFSLTKL